MKKVLIVDDSLFVRVVLINILSENGYEVVAEADNGNDAINKYREYQPDIVTMDITMPGLSGADASKEILKTNPNANILIISALAQQKYIIDLLKSGVKDYLFKPINKDILLATVNAIS